MTSEELEQIQARCDAATPGPWTDMRDDHHFGQVLAIDYPTRIDHICDTPPCDDREADMRFIAHAREDVPKLLAALREARTEADNWRNACKSDSAKMFAAMAERDALRAEVQLERDIAEERNNAFLAAKEQRDAAKAEVERLREAIRKEAIDQVQQELDRSGQNTDRWTLAIGGIFVAVECKDDEAINAVMETP